MEKTSHISFCAASDLGQQRSNNEDAFIAQNIWDNDNVLAVAIDGVGGYEGGEVAASIAKKIIVEYLESYTNGERANLLKQAVVEANNNIFKSRAESEEYKNMSCVLTAVLVETKKGLLHMAHIGDTRLYQYHQGEIKKLSHDHSLVGYREEVGELTEEEAMNHPQRNIIGRDLGSKYMEMNTDQIEIETFKLRSNSILLLCSDGLSDMITSSVMCGILSTSMALEEKVKSLIDKANEAGGKDNITVVLVEYTGEEYIANDVPDSGVETIIDDEGKNEENGYIEDKKFQKSFHQIRSLLMVVVALLFAILLGISFLVYNVIGERSGKNEFEPKLQQEQVVDSLQSNNQ